MRRAIVLCEPQLLNEVPPAIYEDCWRTRYEHLEHEGRILGLVTFLEFLCAFGLFGVSMALLVLLATPRALFYRFSFLPEIPLMTALFTGAAVLVTASAGWASLALRARASSARLLSTMLAVFLLPAAPMGTFLGLYLLWLVHSPAGQRVLSPEYCGVIALTPRMRPPNSGMGHLAMLCWIGWFIGFAMIWAHRVG